jgi:hypothetical protein
MIDVGRGTSDEGRSICLSQIAPLSIFEQKLFIKIYSLVMARK